MKINKVFTTLTSVLCLIILVAFINPKPRILFLLGDSISLQYGTDLQKFLSPGYLIERKDGDSVAFKNLDIPIGANGGDSRMVLSYLQMKIKDPAFRPDVFMLNCGLHDVKRDPKSGKIAVEEKDYRKNLEAIYKLIASKKIPMIWIRTTGVIDSLHRKNRGFNRYLKDIERYNEIADELFDKVKVEKIDLFGFTAVQGENRFVDHAHYTPEVRKLQAAYISGFISLWQSRHKPK